MLFSDVVAFLGLLSLASASTIPSFSKRDKGIPHDIATTIVNDFVSLLTAFNVDVAKNLLAPTFTDTSDSINFLAGLPLGSVTFPSPAAFIAGQGAQPPISLQVLNIDAITHEGHIVFRWVANVGGSLEVKGINVLYAIQSGKDDTVGPSGWQLNTVFSEFNSAAWFIDIGGSLVPPSSGKA